MERIVLYHGSSNIIENPKYKFGNTYNDYGEGFYCTDDLEMAKEWACKDNNNGYVNKYYLDINSFKILDLSNDRYNTFNYLAILIKYRRLKIKNKLKPLINELLKQYYIDVNKYDVVIGYRCDDAMFRYIRDFLSNKISIKQLQEAIRLGNMGKQIVIKSKKAFNKIVFEMYESVNSEDYYKKFSDRDYKAKKEYEKIINRNVDINDQYLVDILRKEKYGSVR